MSVGERIRKRRKELDMSVDELAKRLGKNRATVYRYESGDIEHLPMDILRTLAIVLETTPQYLIGWSTNENPKVPEKEDEYIEQSIKFNNEFGFIIFSAEELDKLFSYAKFLISQRESKENN